MGIEFVAVPDAPALSVRVRMYRQGLGDCHLITLLRGGEPVFRMMIDCGIYQTASGGAARIREIVADVIAETGGVIDVLAVTHEHWDHVSAFVQARELLGEAGGDGNGRLSARAVWMGWTEDPDDPLAARLVDERGSALRRVALAREAAGRLAPDGALVLGLDGVLGFFGGAGRTSADAMATARAMAARPRYCRPDDEPVEVAPGARIYVLGPPLDPAAIYKLADDGETYGLAPAGRLDRALLSAIEAAVSGSAEDDDGQPFDCTYRVLAPFLPSGAATGADGAMPPGSEGFFDEFYVGVSEDLWWRRIDGDWLDGSRDLALKLDNATNNTSLALALELVESGKVLLFAADAQVGSWLSWLELGWDVDGGRIGATDLLGRTVFLKVGHHGSHNATLRHKGLEAMGDDLVAFIPTDEALARRVGWGRMPLPSLVAALGQRTGGRVVRADQDFQAGGEPAGRLAEFARALAATDLYYEIEIG